MTVRVQLPDLEHWKAQVKCQAGLPRRRPTPAATSSSSPRGATRRPSSSRGRPTPSPRSAAACAPRPARTPAGAAAIDAPISIRALKRYVTERYGVESRRPDTQDRLREQPVLEGNRLPRATCRSHPARPAAAGATRRKVAVVGAGPAGHVGGPRPRPPRLRRHGLRGLGRAGRHDALRHPRVPPAPHAHPRGDREDPRRSA